MGCKDVSDSLPINTEAMTLSFDATIAHCAWRGGHLVDLLKDTN